MDKRTSHRWPLLLTILAGCFLAFGSYWILHQMQGDVPVDGDAFKNEPDYIVEKFSFVRMTADGKPHYLLSGAKLTHRPVDDTSEVELPVLQNLAPGTPPSTIVARRARIHHAQNQVDLMGQVDIKRPESPLARALRLQTEALTVFPDEDRMQSAVAVRLTLGDSTITGTGMQANNATRQLHFASRGQIVYPPKGGAPSAAMTGKP